MTDGGAPEWHDLDDLLPLADDSAEDIGLPFFPLHHENPLDATAAKLVSRTSDLDVTDAAPENSRITSPDRVEPTPPAADSSDKLLITSPVGNAEDPLELPLTPDIADPFTLGLVSCSSQRLAGEADMSEYNFVNADSLYSDGFSAAVDALHNAERDNDVEMTQMDSIGGLCAGELNFASDDRLHVRSNGSVVAAHKSSSHAVNGGNISVDDYEDDEEDKKSRVVVNVNQDGVIEDEIRASIMEPSAKAEPSLSQRSLETPSSRTAKRSSPVKIESDTQHVHATSPVLNLATSSPTFKASELPSLSPLRSSANSEIPLPRISTSAISKLNNTTVSSSVSNTSSSTRKLVIQTPTVTGVSSTQKSEEQSQPLTLAEKRRIESARFPHSALASLEGTTSAEVRKMSGEERELVLYKRKLRNRESARRSRQKRQATLAELQDDVEELMMVSGRMVDIGLALRAENASLSNQLDIANAELRALRSVCVNSVSAGVPSHMELCMSAQTGRAVTRPGLSAVENAKLGG